MRIDRGSALLLAASIVLSIGLAEVLLRVAGFSYPSFIVTDPHFGHRLKPGARGHYAEEGKSYVRINAQGMRDDREVAAEKPADRYRIAILGDSYAEGVQLDVSKLFWRILEDRLNRCGFAPGKHVEVLNFGVSGYSTGQELLVLRKRVPVFNPDLVVLAFLSGNDVRDNSRALAHAYPRPYFSLAAVGQLVLDDSFREQRAFKVKSSTPWQVFQALSEHSRVFQLVNKVKNTLPIGGVAAGETDPGWEAGLDAGVYLSKPSPAWEAAWETTEALLAEARSETQRQGAKFLLVSLTNAAQVDPVPEEIRERALRLGEIDLYYPERRLSAFAKREGIDLVLLAPLFADFAVKHKVYLHGFANTALGTGHWNDRGHALGAELLAQRLCPPRGHGDAP
jgi:hypothetical protein